MASTAGADGPPIAPALVMGVALGGFLDGIALHQILQWHHMLTATADHPSSTVAGLEANTLADGFFHLATWILVVVGAGMLHRSWRAGRLAGPLRGHVGLLLVGWGAFNLVEGLIDHQILGIHHVRTGPDQLWWDIGFLVLGALLVLGGWALQHGGRTLDLCDPPTGSSGPPSR
jgi:uncharacterized membrane protein